MPLKAVAHALKVHAFGLGRGEQDAREEVQRGHTRAKKGAACHVGRAVAMVTHASASDGQSDEKRDQGNAEERVNSLVCEECLAALAGAPGEVDFAEIREPEDIESAEHAGAHAGRGVARRERGASVQHHSSGAGADHIAVCIDSGDLSIRAEAAVLEVGSGFRHKHFGDSRERVGDDENLK